MTPTLSPERKEKLTPRQLEVLKNIHQFIQINGFPPTNRELRTTLKINSDKAITDWLKLLEEKGYISRVKNKARSIKILKKV